MSATIEISLPDALVAALGSDVGDLPHHAIEALVAQAYRSGKLTHAQAAEILGLDRWQTDAFLKSAKAFRPETAGEFAADLATIRKLASE